MKRWICQICNKSFINKFCGELKTFIRDSISCETCKFTNHATILTNNILLKSSCSFESSSYSSFTKDFCRKNSIKKTYDSTHPKSFLNPYNSNKELYHKIIIECNNISDSFNDYYVRTSLEEISRIIKKVEPRPLNEIKIVLGSCLRKILHYDEITLQLHCRTNSQEWKYWCSDIVIYFICRKILFNKPIPICEEIL